MSQTTSTTGMTRRITHDRYVRACTSELVVEQTEDRLSEVKSESEGKNETNRYTVDLESGSCLCPDARYRGGSFCKHAIRAAIVAVYRGVMTPFVARVADYAREQDCPHEYDRLCSGPVGPRLPCPGCVETTDADEWTVFQTVVTMDR